MKIGILIEQYQEIPYWTGVINGQALAKRLAKKGHEVFLIYFRPSEVPEGVSNVLSFRQALFKDFDRLYASSLVREKSVLAVFWSLLRGKKLYISIYDTTLEPLDNRIIRMAFVFLARLGRLVPLAMSRCQKEDFSNRYGLEVSILRPCLWLEKREGEKASDLALLFIGSGHDESRGLPDLLEAVAILKKKFPNITLTVTTSVGRYNNDFDPMIKLAKRLGVENRVVFKEIVDMAEEFLNCWVYVFPPRDFHFLPPVPFTLLEAPFFNRPVVATDFRYSREVLPERCLVPPSRPEALAERIKTTLENPSLPPFLREFLPETTVGDFVKIVIGGKSA